MEKLIKFRKKKNLSVKEIHNQIGVSRSYYEKIEYGQRKAGNGFINKMIKAFPEDRNKILKMFF